MNLKRTHIVLPTALLAEIDGIAGERGRSAFIATAVDEAVRRRRLLAAVQQAKGAWKSNAHPELRQGAAAFVKKLRNENEARNKNR